jgi:hypothetical protein
MKTILSALMWALVLVIIVPRKRSEVAQLSPTLIVMASVLIASLLGQHLMVRWFYYVYLMCFIVRWEIDP